MSTFKKLAGRDNFITNNKLRTNDLVANTITTNRIVLDLSSTDANLFYWDICGDDFFHDKSVAFPGDISGTTGRFIYKTLTDVSTSWETIVDNSFVILRNKQQEDGQDVISISGSLLQGNVASHTADVKWNAFVEGSGNSVIPLSNTQPNYSHVEGVDNTVSDYLSHAEGKQTKAQATVSHSEGHGTIANATAAHAEGHNTEAHGYASHAEGKASKTTSDSSWGHALGVETIVSGNAAKAIGYKTKSQGEAAFASGEQTVATGNYSHAAGYKTTVSENGVAGLATGLNTSINSAGGVAVGKWNKTTEGVNFVVGDGTSSSPSDAFLVSSVGNSVNSTHDISINSSLLTHSIHVNDATLQIGDTKITGGRIDTTSMTSYSDISARFFVGDGLYITDVKGWNFTSDSGFITNAKQFLIDSSSGLPIIDTSMSAFQTEAVKTLYFSFDSDNVNLDGENVANDMIVINKKSSYVYLKPNKDYGKGSKFTIHFPPHVDANTETHNLQVFNDASLNVKIGNEILQVSRGKGFSVHVVFDTDFDSSIANDTLNTGSAITYQEELEGTQDKIFLTDSSAIIYSIDSITQTIDFSYSLMTDGSPENAFFRSAVPTRGDFDFRCEAVTLSRDGTIYACYAPPSGDNASSGGALVALKPDGTKKWKMWTDISNSQVNPVSGYPDGSLNFAPYLFPVIDNNLLFVAPAPGFYLHFGEELSYGANFCCFNLETNPPTLKWRYPIDYQEVVKTTPIVDKDGKVYLLTTWEEKDASLNTTRLHAINSSGGAGQNQLGSDKVAFSAWFNQTGAEPYQYGKAYTSGSTMAITRDGDILVCNVDGVSVIEEYIDIFGNTRARSKWTYSLNNILFQPQAIARSGMIYFGGGFTDNYKLYAISKSPYNETSGLLSWESNSVGLIMGGPVVDNDGVIYVCNTLGAVLAFDASGTMLWSKTIQFSNNAWNSTPAIGEGGILYITTRGTGVLSSLVALSRTAKGSTLWTWRPPNGSALNSIIRTLNFKGQWPMHAFNYHGKGSCDFYDTIKRTTFAADAQIYSNTTTTTSQY